MSYRIDYARGSEKHAFSPRRKSRFGKFLVFTVLLALFLSLCFGSQSAIRNIFLPAWDEKTVQAFQTMLDDLFSGENSYEAIASFCREVLELE